MLDCVNRAEQFRRIMIELQNMSVVQLRRIIKIRGEIEALKNNLQAIIGDESIAPARRKMSRAAKAKIAAAQRKRWAKMKKGNAKPAVKKRRKMSAAAKAKLAAAARARWAKAKAAGRNTL